MRNKAGFLFLKQKIKDMDTMKLAITKQWVIEHPNSSISAFLIATQLRGKLPMNEIADVMSLLTPQVKNTKAGKDILYAIEVDRLTSIGKTAPDFTQPDLFEENVSLSNFRGQYVLVNFWASWNFASRTECQNLVTAFHTYQHRNFTILSVSLDNNRTSWLNAIKEERLYWSHVCDFRAWQNDAVRKYDINTLPSNFLLDPNGTIIAKNLVGEDLHAKLQRI